MKKWALILGLAGALWMVLVLCSKSLSLALVSNYPGVFAARWVQYRGIAPSAGTIFAFNVWLVLTSALEWIAVVLIVRSLVSMRMRRIGFRRVLPLLFTVVHLAFVSFAQTHQSAVSTHLYRDSECRSIAYQQSTGVPVEAFESSPLKPLQKIALILELPAMFLATLIAAAMFPRDDAAWMYMSIPLVPLVWYVIGKWLDGLFGYSDRLRLPGILRRLLTVFAVGVLFVSIVGLTPLYHHRTADTYWVFTGLVLWSGLCLAMVSSSKRRIE
jgi:hypothetical protein